jgi:tRNA A-37 threonylcarbamoyl transferase component Bud32
MPVSLSHIAARVRFLARRPAGWVRVHPRWRRRLARWGLTAAGDFLDLPGEVVSGHPDRHVRRVVLGYGQDCIVGFLKREHRVPWRDRFANAWAGFGWVSKSEREARLLRDLRHARVPAPPWVAYGTDSNGRAFLLVRALPGATDLRTFLHRAGGSSRWLRRELAHRLGRLLARVHRAGFGCPDLWSKHVLVRPRLRLAVIDWQRSRRRPRVPWAVRVRDLAALHASLAGELASPRDRLRCLRAYLRMSLKRDVALRDWARLVEWHAAGLRRRRSVRELLRPPLAGPAQRLRWIDGEALCVTRAFWQRCCGRVPDWLAAAARAPMDRPRQREILWRGRRLVLRESPPAGAFRRWVARLRDRRATSPEVRQSGLIHRLQRHGVPGPQLLAFGHRVDGAGFILVQPPAGTVPLSTWLAADPTDRAQLLGATGRLVRRLHDAGCRLTDPAALHIRERSGRPMPILADVAAVRQCRRRGSNAWHRELDALARRLGLTGSDAAALAGRAARVA